MADFCSATVAGFYAAVDTQAWDKATVGTGLNDDDLFSANNQDKMGVALLEHRGFGDFMSGQGNNSDAASFGHELSREWAILPRMTGSNPNDSYYDGVQGNSSGANAQEFEYVLDRVQNAPRAGTS
ncbi:hypothetical protein [Yoonia sp. R2-816]|uniref:hypothetical protein n=1 Tax=Yoonia sp. R2-816 TaxID=3342638 RepID=UPI00372ACF5F